MVRSEKRAKANVYGEFHLRGQNTRVAPLVLRWQAAESLYYGGQLQVVSGPTAMKTRFERRLHDRDWMKNDPDKIAGNRPFTESYYATVAFLIAFAEAERLAMETVQSPVPMTSTMMRQPTLSVYSDIDDFDRDRPAAGDANGNGNETASAKVSGTIRAG